MEFTAEFIASVLGGEIAGDPQARVSSISKIEEGMPGTLSFLSNPKYEPYLYSSDASIIIVNKSLRPSKAVKATMIRVDDAYACFAKILEIYDSMNRKQRRGVSSMTSIAASSLLPDDAYIGEFTVIGENLKAGKGICIYPQVYIGDNVTLGENVTLFPGVRIFDGCVLGNNVTINSGCVIGADGFGFAPTADNTYNKIPQLGNVVIEDDVEIGANTCIDRATMGSTVVRHGVKLDNLIQLGHNVTVGENSVLAAQVGVAGSSKVGKNCMIGGQVGIAGHLSIGDGAKLASKAGISNNVFAGETHMGYPSMPGIRFHRSHAIFRNLPELNIKVGRLEKEIKKLRELLGADE